MAFAHALGFALLIWSGCSEAQRYQATPETYLQDLRSLAPGDTLQLSPGTYQDGLTVHDLQGHPDQPIIITGPENGAAATLLAQRGTNTISLADAAYIVIRNLTLNGRNLPVDGVKAEGYSRFAHHIILENLHIIGHGNNQQTVGISTKCPSWGWIIRGNVIEAAGTGMYLGNSDGRAPFWAGLIEGNRVVDSIGYDLQIKHQNPRTLVQDASTAPAVTIIRNNLFGKSHNASFGGMARPNVLLGHWPLLGPGTDDRYLVYGNLFVDNPAEALFQAEGRLALYNNVFINRQGDGIHIQPHNDIPRDMDIFYNTVLARDAGIVIRQKPSFDERFAQRVEANLISAARPLEGGEDRHNVMLRYQETMDKLYPASRLSSALLRASKTTEGVPRTTWGRFAAYPEWNSARADPSVPGAAGADQNDGFAAYLSGR
ncbi:MAG: hypothetical protein ACLPXB_00425 [Thiobacillaceae bacterium]